MSDIKDYLEGNKDLDNKNEEMGWGTVDVIFDNYFGELFNRFQKQFKTATISEYDIGVKFEFDGEIRGILEVYVMDQVDGFSQQEVVNDRELIRTFMIDAIEYSEGFRPDTDNVLVGVKNAPPESIRFKVRTSV